MALPYGVMGWSAMCDIILICCLYFQGQCVEMLTGLRKAGKWRTIKCSDVRGYICESFRSECSLHIQTKLPENSRELNWSDFTR